MIPAARTRRAVTWMQTHFAFSHTAATTISVSIQLPIRGGAELTVFVTTNGGNGHYAGITWTRQHDAATRSLLHWRQRLTLPAAASLRRRG